MRIKKFLLGAAASALLASALTVTAFAEAPVTEPAESTTTEVPIDEGLEELPENEDAATYAAGVAIDEINFPNETFRKYVQKNFDKDEDGSLSESEISSVKKIGVYTHDNVFSLKGIELFPNLEYLSCNDNGTVYLDVSKNTALTELYCWGNKLTSLDLSKNTALKILDCHENQLTSLDVSKNTALEKLSCSSNQLSSLDLSKNMALEELGCGGNKLTALDVSKHTALTKLYCSAFNRGSLTSLNASGCTALTELDCTFNQLTYINVSGCTALKTLYCYSNLLTSLDISDCAALEDINCHTNKLTYIDVSKNTALEKLWCVGNKLTFLDLNNNLLLNSMNTDNNITIYGKTGYYAEEYAYSRGLTFIDGPAPVKPTKPTGLTATGADRSVALKWDVFEGATMYRVQRLSGSVWESVAFPRTNAYTDTGLSAGTKYSYRVLAFTDVWSEPCGVVTATTNKASVIPAKPTGLTGTPASGQITLKWNAVSGAAQYRVQQYISGSWKSIAFPKTNSYTHKGLTNGAAYSYRVLAYANGVWGTPTAGIKVRAGGTTPTGLTGTPGIRLITLKWNSVSGATQYRVQQYVHGEGWKSIAFPKTNSYTHKGLMKGAAYSYRVLAYVGGKWGTPTAGIKVRVNA